MNWRLKKTVQCAKCPWRKDVDPFDIPNGYDVEKHKALKGTIASGINLDSNTMKIMACHESSPEDEIHCVGWVNNQLGVGNNIALRMSMRDCENIRELTIKGEQHDRFEDTLPESKS